NCHVSPRSLGLRNYWPASILSFVALADLLGRLLCGWVANTRLFRNLQLLTMVVSLLGVVLMLIPSSNNYWAILALSWLYGFFFGCIVAIHVTSIMDIVSLEEFDSGLGLFMLFRSTGGVVGPPLAGFLVDQTGNYSAAFYLSGLCLISSAAFIILNSLNQRSQENIAQAQSSIHSKSKTSFSVIKISEGHLCFNSHWSLHRDCDDIYKKKIGLL
uniref:Major facilitator superfamily (MFS) profile domain-containing protein n=1 Tax=Neogobius melanostomus TaxID=47308 RepID=A0A8C6UL69_9GOBI